MKNKKGFTLIELIAVIVIIGVIALVAIPRISDLILKGKNNYYKSIEDELVILAKDYYTSNYTKLPTVISDKGILITNTLLKNGYIDEMIKDEKSEACDNSYIAVTLVGNNKYNYDACLICPNYETNSNVCAATKDAAPYMERVVHEHSVLTVISDEEVDEIKSNINAYFGTKLIDISASEKTLDLSRVNVNVLGIYPFYFSVNNETVSLVDYESVIKVVDNIAPTVNENTITSLKGEVIDIINSLNITDNYYSRNELEVIFEAVDTIDINAPGDYGINVTVIDPSSNITTKKVTVSVEESIVSFSPNSQSWTSNDVDVTITPQEVSGTITSWGYRLGNVVNGKVVWSETLNTITENSTMVSLSNNGTNAIKVEINYVDNVGTPFTLSQASGWYKIDKTYPECGNISGTSTQWTKQNRAITVGCINSISGCTNSSFSKTFDTTTKNGSIIISSNAGLTTSCEIVNVNVDKTAPSCNGYSYLPELNTSSPNWTNTNRQVDVTCKDDESGCVNNVYPKIYDTTIQTTTSANGIIISDNAGNTTTCYDFPVYADLNSPTCSITGVASTNNLKITGTDVGSGISGYSWDGTSYSSTQTISAGDINKTFTGYVKDNSGRVTNCSATVSAWSSPTLTRVSSCTEYNYYNSKVTCSGSYYYTWSGTCYPNGTYPPRPNVSCSSASCPSGYSGSCSKSYHYISKNTYTRTVTSN